jgi:hypothetical protein
MLHNGRTSYKVPAVKVRTPLNTRLRGRAEKPIVSIDTISPANGVGFEIIDMVGSGRRGNTRQAEGMKEKLAGSPSRYVWKNFESRVAGIQKGLDDILKRYAAKVNVKLRTM